MFVKDAVQGRRRNQDVDDANSLYHFKNRRMHHRRAIVQRKPAHRRYAQRSATVQTSQLQRHMSEFNDEVSKKCELILAGAIIVWSHMAPSVIVPYLRSHNEFIG